MTSPLTFCQQFFTFTIYSPDISDIGFDLLSFNLQCMTNFLGTEERLSDVFLRISSWLRLVSPIISCSDFQMLYLSL